MKKTRAICLFVMFVLLPITGNSQDAFQYLQQLDSGGGLTLETDNLENQTDLSPEALKMLREDAKDRIRKIQDERLSTTAALDEKETITDSPKILESSEVEKSSERVSVIEAQYRNRYNSTLSSNLRHFGYDIFKTAHLQSSRMVVPDDEYIIGPGDRLNIRVWGSGVEGDFSEYVATDGNIDVPQIGVLKIAGVKLGNAAHVIRQEAEKYIQGINIHVSLAEFRSVEVYVVGAVNSPGLQVVPAFSTVMGGLLSAGGVAETGSLRMIELYRNNKLHLKVDLYELLLDGKRDFDVVLENDDVIYVPRISKTAAVAGAVNNAAIFELGQEKTLGDLIDLAGGILPQGFTGRIYLRRFADNSEFVIRDLDTDKVAQPWKSVELTSGDMLEFHFIPSDWPEVIRLTGNVKIPDVYKFRSGMMLSDILTTKDLIKENSIMEFGHLYRLDSESTQTALKQFPLADVFSGNFDLELQPFDKIVILSREEMEIIEEISVFGAVWQPGKFLFRPNMTLNDALSLTGGKKFGAHTQRIELSRQTIDENQVLTTHKVLNIEHDGGFTLQPYDYVFVPRVKDATVIQTVTLTGEVKFPGQYRIKNSERVSSVIARAGGFTEGAYFYGAKYTSEKARSLQQESINRMLQNLDVEAQRILGAEAQTALSAQDVTAAVAAQTTIETMLSRLSKVKAEGRVSIQIMALDKFQETEFDFEMENGDILDIPKRPNFVAVVGSVYNPSAYLWEERKTLSKYLSKSGGPTKSADEKQIYVIKANGEVFSKRQASKFNDLALMPGDTIVVPEDLERVPYLRLVKDITDIVFKIAVTVGVLVAIL